MCFSTSHTEKTEKPATALHREGVCKQGDTVPAKGEERRMEQNRIEQTSGTQNLSECPSGTISPVLWSRNKTPRTQSFHSAGGVLSQHAVSILSQHNIVNDQEHQETLFVPT